MQAEAVLVFKDILTTQGSLLELLDTDHSFFSEQLAKHYNIPALPREKNVQHGDTLMRRYELPDMKRGGVLTMAVVLAVTSNPDRTSPVKRGKWVLEALLANVHLAMQHVAGVKEDRFSDSTGVLNGL